MMKTRINQILVLTAIATVFQMVAMAQMGGSVDAPVAHDSWTSGAPMPTPRQGVAIGAVGTKVYVVGGATNKAVVSVMEIYNTAKNRWTTGPSMPTPRFVPASAVVNTILYVFGGQSGSGVLNVVEAYDTVRHTWSKKASMPTPRDSIYAVAENGIIYVIGGYSPNGGRLTTVESYNPVSNKWTKRAPLKVGKSLPATGLLGSTILAAGGLANSGIVADNEGYNALHNKWKTLPPVPTARQGGCAWGIQGQLYFASGIGGVSGNPVNVLEAYSQQNKTWMTLASIPQAVANPGSADVGNRLYCFGGSNDGRLFQGTVYNDLQIYQP